MIKEVFGRYINIDNICYMEPTCSKKGTIIRFCDGGRVTYLYKTQLEIYNKIMGIYTPKKLGIIRKEFTVDGERMMVASEKDGYYDGYFTKLNESYWCTWHLDGKSKQRTQGTKKGDHTDDDWFDWEGYDLTEEQLKIIQEAVY